jgi:hypothetical protein
LLILREKGYRLQLTSSGDANGERICTYMAEKDGNRFAGNSGPELLGLVTLWEHFGEGWNRQEPDVLGEVTTDEEDFDA